MQFMTSLWLCLVCMVALIHLTKAMPERLRIGALFEPDYEGQWRALEWAVEEINLKSDLLAGTLVLVDRDTVPPQDSFTAQRKVCRMSQEGIAAMFGPVSAMTAAHVQSMCNAFEIPHLQWRWDPRDKRDYFSISLYPHYLTLSTAYKDVVQYWNWNRFTILYEDNEGLTRLQEVLKAAERTPAQITVRKLEMVNSDYLVLLKELQNRGEYRFIVDCNVKTVTRFLHAGLKLKMISELYHFFFTTLDLGLLDLSDYMHGGANITAYRLIDPDREKVISVRTSWLFRSKIGDKSPLMEYSEIDTETALAYDAYVLFAKALHSLSEAQEVNTISLPCDKVHTWRYGNSLLNYMKAMKFEGLSGTVKYENGERYDFDLDLLYLTQNGLHKVGKWNRKSGLNVSLQAAEAVDQGPGNKVYVVSAYETEPYVIRNASSPSGFSGFCVELLDMIAKAKNFSYRIELTDTVGKEQSNGSWNGVMGALIDRKADIGIGDLTINLVREQQVDFTKPFLTLGITILYKRPAPKSLNLFSFLQPLSVDVWVYMIAAYLCVSFMLFVIARFSPYEWCNPHPCNPDTDEVENQFTVMNSLWFTIGSLMQQGCEIAPRALSTRMVAGMWWFFTLIMISSYTANLAAFLTVERMVSDINSADDLAKQTKIKYGTFAGGATQEFFQKSNMPPFDRMWNFMNATGESAFVQNLTEAVERVKTGDYAYITESTTVKFVVERNCNLMQIGGLLDTKGYGFATPQGSSLREHLTEEILRLTELQDIERLRVKWWEKELGGGKCHKEEGSMAGKANELGVENVGGVFVFLMGGVVIGFFVSICEFVWKAKKNAKKDKQTLCSEMSEEFRFAVRCLGSKKSKKKENDEITDNGLQFMPLTGYNQNAYGKEVYA
ncbi:glutamate receptor subunit protein GluR7 precursor [Aplysia californica]|uniref:Glutamate receptor 1 n=1 Tax=Aplysia californica TaxID=6500 RepID=Q7Z1H3_APLCA|nr:glutamate receptor subunit protein GluR7 precursor [Aplysia californica]AAP41209.1 glutamate receptor subunit protein GluR7 [Aplysia californica]